MELKFESIEELEKFIVEQLGYVKKDENNKKTNKDEENEKFALVTVKECPYGFTYCPYNNPVKTIDPYTPTYPLYCSKTDTKIQEENSRIEATKSIDIKDLSEKNLK